MLAAARALADLIMPRICISCGRRLHLSEMHLCTVCLSDLPFTHFEQMAVNPMADQLNELIQRDIEAGNRGFETYSNATALFFYRDGYRNITKALKYNRNFAAGQYFSCLLGRTLAQSELFTDVDTIVPVPLHWTRRIKRGYNQAEIIAKNVAKNLPSANVRPSLLVRNRRTRSQVLLGREQKNKNVQNAFNITATGNFPAPKHILIVDDVFTTGATIAACHNALRKRFGPDVRISVATLAFTGE